VYVCETEELMYVCVCVYVCGLCVCIFLSSQADLDLHAQKVHMMSGTEKKGWTKAARAARLDVSNVRFSAMDGLRLKAHMGFNTTQYRRLHSFLLANGVRLLHPTGKMSAHERSMCTDFETGTITINGEERAYVRVRTSVRI
jgi:hypothetical protein